MADVGLRDEYAEWGLTCGMFTGTTILLGFEDSTIKVYHNNKQLVVKAGFPGTVDADFVYFENDVLSGIVLNKTIGFEAGDIIKFELKLNQTKDLPFTNGKFVIGMF